eukprot:11379377-Ditylum_brightwellii.AAC.1
MLQVSCFADADFAGSFSVEDPQDVTSVRSRTCYALTFAGCPILWVSKLQTKMTDLLPTKELITEVVKDMWQKDRHKELKFVSKSTVYEDNNGAIRVASCLKLTATSKFIAVKYHWFKQHVEPGEVDIVKVKSRKQLVDIFTKELQGINF